MDRQTLRDWVIRFNEQGPDGLINIPSPGVPPKLNSRHKAFLARIVEEGPIPAIHGVVRWRACDLIMRLYEEFGLSVSDDTLYRALKKLGFSHMSAQLLLRLEHTHRPTVEDYVHRATRLGSSRSLNLRIGISRQNRKASARWRSSITCGETDAPEPAPVNQPPTSPTCEWLLESRSSQVLTILYSQ